MHAPPVGNRRRGFLLLLVLCMLTLFLLMGTVMLTLATRTRKTARAFAAATVGQSAGPLLARRQLDRAVLSLLRGSPDATAAGLSESLLADMYGETPPLKGRVTSLTANGPLVEATVELPGARAADLCGRVITFDPDRDTGSPVMSLRILRASGTSPFTCWIARLQAESESVLPSVPCAVLVNQPAFREEAYDAYDAANPWLTKVALEDGRVKTVPRPAFAATGAAATVDNDNDGVNDGVWLQNIFDSQPAPGGGRLEFDASYLVLDLDGRVNVNAHGSRTSIDYPADTRNGTWPSAPAVPTGSGYGPADVDGSLLFVGPLASNTPQTDPPAASDRWRRIIGATAVDTLIATTSTLDQRRPVPLVGPVDGRYGVAAAPGLPATNDRLSERNDRLFSTGSTAPLPTSNSLIDLKSMIKVNLATTASGRASELTVPEMVYFCPDWTKANYVDDPYEMRLDSDAPKPGELRTVSHADNPFTPADLEAVLRQFDADASMLSPRLAVALDDASQRSRMLVTTDSWDTPGLTGAVASRIADYIAALRCDPKDVISPDVLAGLRFDINRPFPDGTTETEAKQLFCRHLYVLCVALGRPADATTAQWAANVVDYRDPDSNFTRFQFDTDPADGWGAGTNGWSSGNVVWGLERPELLIAQTIAYYVVDNTGTITTDDGLYVSLYRPSWTERLTTVSNSQNPTVVVSKTAPTIDLAEKSSQSSQPVWRLRIEPGTSVRFDKPGSGEKAVPGIFRKTGGGATDAQIGPDSYLVVMPAPVKTTGNQTSSTVTVPVDNAFKKFEINSGGTFKATSWPGAASYQSGADTIVFLERLEDPTKPWNDTPTNSGYNPYVILDRLGVKRVNRTGEGNNWKTYIRESSVWNNGPFETTGDSAGIVQLNPAVKSWLPWPNRPFISHAELVLVSQANGAGRFWDYKTPKNKRASNPFYELPTPLLLDATIVPSRFAGSQVTVDPATLTAVGMDKIPFNQLSRWREPGRVNLNTIVSNTNCTDPQLNDAVWWATMGPDAAVSLDEFVTNQNGNGQPAKTIQELLTLMQDQAIYIDSAAAAGVKGNSWKKNRPYDLNPMAAYATATRLANVATIRSHMFGVWVTLRVRDTSPGGIDSYHRVFAIVDRSRPVGFAAGRDLNVRDTIRVLRYLD